MVDKALVNYIHETSDSGFSPDQIRQTLTQAGWFRQEIDEAFASTAKPPLVARKVTLPQDRGFVARHRKALVVILALIILLPLAALGARWGYEKFARPQKNESAVQGETAPELLETLIITDLAQLPFYPFEEATLSLTPPAGVELASAFLIIANMKLVDRQAPFSFSFAAPGAPGEYRISVFAFDKNGVGYTQTTKLIVKGR